MFRSKWAPSMVFRLRNFRENPQGQDGFVYEPGTFIKFPDNFKLFADFVTATPPPDLIFKFRSARRSEMGGIITKKEVVYIVTGPGYFEYNEKISPPRPIPPRPICVVFPIKQELGGKLSDISDRVFALDVDICFNYNSPAEDQLIDRVTTEQLLSEIDSVKSAFTKMFDKINTKLDHLEKKDLQGKIESLERVTNIDDLFLESDSSSDDSDLSSDMVTLPSGY